METKLLRCYIVGFACLLAVGVPSVVAAEEPKVAVVSTSGYGEVEALAGEDALELDSIVVKGPVNAGDFKALRNWCVKGKLRGINLKEADIEGKAIPFQAFHTAYLNYIDFPDDVETISDGAFYFSFIKKISLPKSLKSIGVACFRGCRYLSGAITIPENITEIPTQMFQGCGGIESVILPAGLKKIGDFAFYDTRIKDIAFPKGLESIGMLAFCGSEELEEVDLPSSVKSIGAECFNQCWALKKAVLPEGLSEIPEKTFYYCKSLESVNIPSGVSVIGKNAFEGCGKLKELELKTGLRVIDEDAFAVSGLETLDLPEGIVTLEENSFDSLSALKCVVSRSVTPPSAINVKINSDNHYAFNGSTPRNIPVYVPENSVKDYRAAPGWDWFTNILPMSAMSGVIDMSAASGDVKIHAEGRKIRVELSGEDVRILNAYDISGKMVLSEKVEGCHMSGELAPGIYIVKVGDIVCKINIR